MNKIAYNTEITLIILFNRILSFYQLLIFYISPTI